MNVNLAAQILSSTVSKSAGTAKLCSLMNMFFDIMNIRDINSHKFDLQPSLLPFLRVEGPGFSWLENVFLQYFEDWLTSIQQLPRNFSRNPKGKMFISQDT